MNEIQYRWKIIDPQGVLKGEWMSTKQNCLHDFMQNPHVPQEERKIYLYKRIPISAGKRYFRMIGKSKYEQFRWKVKCQWNVFHPSKNHEPAWTLIEGDWTDDFKKCSKDFHETITKGYDFEDSCVPYEYLYMRRPFPIKVKRGRSKSV